MATKMGNLPIKKVLLHTDTMDTKGEFEFIIDCESVYFNALYDNEGKLQYLDQYFYTQQRSHDDLNNGIDEREFLGIDDQDFPVKSYLLAKEEKGNEWLRFHAVVPREVNPDYFQQKYLGE